MIPEVGKNYYLSFSGPDKECDYNGPGTFSGSTEIVKGDTLYEFINLSQKEGFTSKGLFSSSDIVSEINSN
jgi:hypothetical protein